MGGYDGSFHGRWRWLDGVRAWCDAHDLVAIAAVCFASVLLTLAFVGTVAITTIWVRVDSLEDRVSRVEHAVYMRAEKETGKETYGNATAAEF